MSNAPLMLGVSGLRGIVGQSLTPEVAARFARAFGGWLIEHTRSRRLSIVLGADGRAGYQPLYDAVRAALLDTGCVVIDSGIAMTPSIGVKTDHTAAAGAIIITASHNPQEWNGLKCLVRDAAPPQYPSARAPSAQVARQISDRFKSDAPLGIASTTIPAVMHDHGFADHLEPVLHRIGEYSMDGPIRKGRFRVVLDSVNGAGRLATPAMLKHLMCDLHHIGCDDSGIFPHPPEPLAENLTELADAVKRHNADIGFAQDPDADRLAIIDETGRYIGEEYTLVLAARALLEARDASQLDSPAHARGKPVIVTNLSTSRMIDDLATRHDAEVVRTPVGEANVVHAMLELTRQGRHVILGGEGNGGVIWPEVVHVRDSLSAMALTLALMAHTGKSISQLVADHPAYTIEKRKTPLASKDAAAPALNALSRHFSTNPGARIDTQDGVRIDLDNAWLHVRPSNTEPILRLIAEAPTPDAARDLLDHAQRVIAEL